MRSAKYIFIFLILSSLLLVSSAIKAQLLFRVQNTEGKYGFINKEGVVVIKPVFDASMIFNEGYCAVKLDEKWDYIDNLGNMTIKPQYDSAYTFNEGFALVFQDSLAGYIGADGKYKIEPKYYDGMSFSDGMALVQIEDFRWGFIDNKGKVKIKDFHIRYSYDYGNNDIHYWMPFFHSGLVKCMHNQNVFFDKKGKMHKYKYDYVNDFNNGIALLGPNDGYINKRGKLVLSNKYLLSSEFVDGYAWVLFCVNDSNSVFYCINELGEIKGQTLFNGGCSIGFLTNLGNETACFTYRTDYNSGSTIFNTKGDILSMKNELIFSDCFIDIHSGIKLQNTLFLTKIEGERVYINIKGDIVSKYHIY